VGLGARFSVLAPADDYFRSVVLAKILYASPTWCGFANSPDKQRLEAFMRRCVRLNFYRQDDSTVVQLVANLDDGLFAAVLSNDQHVLPCVLLERKSHSYSLRPRRRELVLTTKRDSRNFFDRHYLKICIDILFSCVLSTVFKD